MITIIPDNTLELVFGLKSFWPVEAKLAHWSHDFALGQRNQATDGPMLNPNEILPTLAQPLIPTLGQRMSRVKVGLMLG